LIYDRPDVATAPEKWTVLAVDDEPNILVLLETLLSREGHEVVTASSGEEGKQLLQSRRFDMVLTDKNMPGVNGIELARFARSKLPDACVVMITGFASEQTAHELTGILDDYLEKPFRLNPLRQRLRELMARRVALNQARRALAAPVLPGRSSKFLVIEADPAARDRIGAVLKRLGHSYEDGTGSEQRIRDTDADGLVVSAQSCSKEIHRAIWQLQSRLWVAAERRDLAMIVITEKGSLDGTLVAVSLGASARVVRPFDDLELESAVRASLDRGPK
jgi:DNA-binding response OmpR family regulator